MNRTDGWIPVFALAALRLAACAGDTTDSASRTNASACETDRDCSTTAHCVSKRCVSKPDSGLFSTGGGASTGGAHAGGRGGSGNAAGAGGQSGAGTDAGSAVDGGCHSGTYPLLAKLDLGAPTDSGLLRCFAELPQGVDLEHAKIEAGLTVSGAMSYVTVRRDDAPCTNQASYRHEGANEIEICNLCQTNFGLSFRAVVDCSSSPADASTDATDGCVRKTVTASMRRDDRGCTVDLPPNADRTIPITSSLPFGILGGGGVIHFGVGYEPSPSCDDSANSGWQPIAGTSTVRLCQGVCFQPLYDGMPFTVTLMCGADGSD